MQKRLFYEKASGASAENEGSLFKSAGAHGRTNERTSERTVLRLPSRRSIYFSVLSSLFIQ